MDKPLPDFVRAVSSSVDELHHINVILRDDNKNLFDFFRELFGQFGGDAALVMGNKVSGTASILYDLKEVCIYVEEAYVYYRKTGGKKMWENENK